jgi:hypothetical protein
VRNNKVATDFCHGRRSASGGINTDEHGYGNGENFVTATATAFATEDTEDTEDTENTENGNGENFVTATATNGYGENTENG